MVSTGDTDISLHIRPGPISNLEGGESKLKTSKCQDQPKFEFSWGEGGYSGQVKSEKC